MPEADQLFDRFVQAYPASRRQRGYWVEQLFLVALEKTGFPVLLAAVEQHKRSEQWQTARLIPNLKTWLEEERWNQELPEAPAGGRTDVVPGKYGGVSRRD